VGQSDQIVLHLARTELPVLAARVNEAIEGVGDWEFPARLAAIVEGESVSPD
jgi:hypothetical protein